MSNIYRRLKATASLLLSLTISACSADSAQTSLSEKELLGNWCARSQPAFYQEFVIEIEDGKHGFRSYLHHRPDEFGTWELDKNQLTINGNSGIKTEYKIEASSAQSLVLISSLGDKEYYFRDGCVEFEAPPEQT
jgi:hypothetical protein